MTHFSEETEIRALDVARARLIHVTSRVIAFAWAPLIAIGAIRFWPESPRRAALAVFQVLVVLTVAVALWRPRRGRTHWQAAVLVALLYGGLVVTMLVNGVQTANVAVAAVMVGWATLYDGGRGLWSTMAGLALLYAVAWFRFAVLKEGAPLVIDVRDPEMLGRFLAMSLMAILLSGYLTKIARDVYESAIQRERAALEARAREEAARMEAEGQAELLQRRQLVFTLASGLAHDLNNIVQITMGEAALLRQVISDSGQRASLDRVQAAAQQAKRLLRDLMDLGRQSPVGVAGFDATTVLARANVLLRGVMPSGVELCFETESPPCVLAGTEVRFEQVVINLVLNARDAMPTGGQLRVVVHEESATMCRLEVSDTGVGVPDALRASLFDPYVTSNAGRAGTGLGLAMVHRAVEDVGGQISYASAPGTGTKFTVLWPRLAT